MKKLIWFLLLMLGLFTLSDHPLLRPYKDALYNKLASEAESATKINGSQAMRSVTRELNELGEQMGKAQQDELKKVQQDNESLKQFYTTYCINKEFHPLFFGDSMNDICQAIEKYRNGLSF